MPFVIAGIDVHTGLKAPSEDRPTFRWGICSYPPKPVKWRPFSYISMGRVPGAPCQSRPQKINLPQSPQQLPAILLLPTTSPHVPLALKG
jgi:hypothetical protein